MKLNPNLRLLLCTAGLFASCLVHAAGNAAPPPTTPGVAAAQAPPPAAPAQRSAADLEKLVAPIALYPDALIDGKEATVAEAVEFAADLLYKANMPLVYGLSNVTCEAQRGAVALAEMIGGVVDSHTSL